MTSSFRDRAEAGRLLAAEIGDEAAGDPVVLAIPRGGVEVGATLAAALGLELDVVFARKLRAPMQPELAIGAVGEDGQVILGDAAWSVPGVTPAFVGEERGLQMQAIAARRALVRGVRPGVPLAGRAVIVTDDGMATGSTMVAALRAVREAGAGRTVVAVPVAAADTLELIRPLCDRIVCLLAPASFNAVGEFYESFDPVEDERVIALLREAVRIGSRPGTSPP